MKKKPKWMSRYKDHKKRLAYAREYQKNWHRKRREEYFRDKSCAECGVKEDLRFLWEGKRTSTSPFSYKPSKRNALLAKTKILCLNCWSVHQRKPLPPNLEEGRKKYLLRKRKSYRNRARRARFRKQVKKMSKEELQALAKRLAKERGII